MLIDWFTVVAQVINFLILMGLLKYVLYDRILRAMDEREQHLASLRRQAETREFEANQAKDEYHRKSRELEDQQSEILAQARQHADTQRQDLIRQIRQEVDATRQRWHETIDQEKTRFLEDLRRRTVSQIHEIARHALNDLANQNFEQHLTDVFLTQLQKMEDGKWNLLNESIHSGQTGIEVQSAFSLPANVQNQIVQTVHNRLGHSVDVDFTVSSDLIAGIEMKGAGHTVAWNLAQYLETLNERMARALDKQESNPGDHFRTPTTKKTPG